MLPYINNPELTETELAEAAKHLSMPVVKKYLTAQAADITVDVIQNVEPADGESTESFLRRRAGETGKLAILTILLGIEAADPGKQQ
jgi:hypothetical protein